jgi:hypothetical protein
LRGAQRRGNPRARAKAAMDCFRHCEERSDVAIIAMTGQGPNDRTGSSLFLKDDKYRNPHFLSM